MRIRIPHINCVNTIPTCDPRNRLVMTCVPSLRVKSRKGLQFLAEVVQVRGSASHRSEIAGFRLGAASGGAGGFLSDVGWRHQGFRLQARGGSVRGEGGRRGDGTRGRGGVAPEGGGQGD